MVDPVFSSRYGQRPLIDIPALQVSSTPHLAITSLQKPLPVYQSPPLTPHHTGGPVHQPNYPRSYHTAPPPDPFHYNHYDPNSRTRQFYGPNGELVKPLETYFDTTYQYPGVIYPPPPPPPPSPPPPPPPPPPAVYPLPPPNPHYHVHPPPFSGQIPHQEFDINCDLEFGRVVRISVRESRGHFRGVPEYLRRELLKGYGKYPFIKVKVRSDRGDFHIFANHQQSDRRREKRERQERRYPHEDRPKDPFYDDHSDDYDEY